jgi:hypothetical protein
MQNIVTLPYHLTNNNTQDKLLVAERIILNEWKIFRTSGVTENNTFQYILNTSVTKWWLALSIPPVSHTTCCVRFLFPLSVLHVFLFCISLFNNLSR